MKKAITILAMIAIVAGAVFATDIGSTAVRVTTSVAAVEPIFQLKTTAVTSATNVATTITPAVSAEDAADAALGNKTASHDITVNALLTAEQTVTFQVIQTNDTRAVKKYQFSAEATDLNLWRYEKSDGTKVLESDTHHPTATDAQKKFTVKNSGVGAFLDTAESKGLSAAQAVYGGTAAAKTVEYKGTNVDANTLVTAFTCTWNANDDAVVGEYEGTVTLSIATV